jgi:hypothetical protein
MQTLFEAVSTTSDLLKPWLTEPSVEPLDRTSETSPLARPRGSTVARTSGPVVIEIGYLNRKPPTVVAVVVADHARASIANIRR